MLVPRFNFRRSPADHGRIGESVFERDGHYRSFCAVGKRLSELKQWAEIVRMAERTGIGDGEKARDTRFDRPEVIR